MKQYKLIKVRDEERVELGVFNTKVEAANKMETFIDINNEKVSVYNQAYLTPFDFTLEELK